MGKGYLIIIGGAEDKHGDRAVLRLAPQLLNPGDRLTILTTATERPEQAGAEYTGAFGRLGVRNTGVLNINTRRDANDGAMCAALRASRCVFMTGGDQLRITSILGGTAACRALKALYLDGGVVMGTSAGASVMSSTMVVEGLDHEPARKCTLKMAPGLGLLDRAIVDQHFDERGRFGRLLCGVAENPDALGIGIDEDTAVKVTPDGCFEVIGTNAVTVIDGSTISSSNVSELRPNELLAIAGVTVHALPAGYGYDMDRREVLRLNRD
jgi:cyanophycinase